MSEQVHEKINCKTYRRASEEKSLKDLNLDLVKSITFEYN